MIVMDVRGDGWRYFIVVVVAVIVGSPWYFIVVGVGRRWSVVHDYHGGD